MSESNDTIDLATEVERLRAENERLREWIRRAASILGEARARNASGGAVPLDQQPAPRHDQPEPPRTVPSAATDLADRFSRMEQLLDSTPPPREAPPRKSRKPASRG